ncbi:type II toxin-antitoxin system RelE/ParE family toxin [Lachnospiraceae bacterium ZAX-1]
MQIPCKVEILPTAWEDLKRIEDYYAIEFGVETALKVSCHILDSLERLEQFPNYGSMIPGKWLHAKGYHILVCGKDVAVHRQIENIVFIYHIADTQTDYTKLFQ